MEIKLSYYDKAHILRQTPGGEGMWGDCKFRLNQNVKECDAWVVFDQLTQVERTICDPNKTIFITAEPPSVRRYNERFLAQFAMVVTPQQGINHPSVMNRHPASHWFAGVEIDEHDTRVPRLNYDTFKSMKSIPKTKQISVICSTKTMTSGHRQRVAFLQQIMEHFGPRIDVFGNGFCHVADKWETLAPYKYSIVLENSCLNHYWTEKISDAFLAQTFPFYFGCPNLVDYFPRESFMTIDLKSPRDVIIAISQAMEEKLYEKALPNIRQARELVLEQYNLFPEVLDIVHRLPSSPRRKVCLKPEWRFMTSPARRVCHDIKRAVHHLVKPF